MQQYSGSLPGQHLAPVDARKSHTHTHCNQSIINRHQAHTGAIIADAGDADSARKKTTKHNQRGEQATIQIDGIVASQEKGVCGVAAASNRRV